MPKARTKKSVRKNFVFPAELAAWADKYAKDNKTTMTRIIIDHFWSLHKQAEEGYVEQV